MVGFTKGATNIDIERVLVGGQKVSFSFQDNFKDAISKDGIGAVTDDGFTAIQVNKISKEAKGWLAFELLTGVSQKDGSFSKGAAASILAISIAAVGLATATGGLA